MKKILPLLLLVLLALPHRAYAQEGPTEGAACSGAGRMSRASGPEITSPNGGNWLICNGSNWIMAWNFNRSAQSQLQFDYDTGTCTAAKAGRIRFNSGSNAWSFCNGIGWSSFGHQGGDSICNFWNQPVGYVCPDGSVFAGFAPGTNYTPLFTTRCDAGQTYTGSCTGTRITRSWNNGNASGHTDVTTGQRNGAASTALLVVSDSNSGAGGTQPHLAAQYCADLVMHGHSDWFLPSTNDLFVLRVHQSAIGGFTTTDNYWTSSQGWLENAKMVEFSGFFGVGDRPKQTAYYIRCVRE